MTNTVSFRWITRLGIGRYGFLFGVILAMGLAWFVPGPGADGGWLRTEQTTRLAVFAIFFIQGLILPTDALRSGVLQWRLHVFVHVFLFLLFPLAALFIDFVFGRAAGWLDPDVRIGLLFLAVLPTTISTSVVFTAQSGGNTAGALFNATVSNILAVLIVPVWVLWATGYRVEGQATFPMIAGIATLVLLPLGIGQAIRLVLRTWANKHSKRLRTATNIAILFIIYAAFAGSMDSGVWAQEHGRAVAVVCVFTTAYFLIIHGLAWCTGPLVGFRREDRVAAFFSAPQKSLAMGVPMAQLIFSDRVELGLIILPLMIYHTFQLLLGGFLVGRWMRGLDKKPVSQSRS